MDKLLEKGSVYMLIPKKGDYEGTRVVCKTAGTSSINCKIDTIQFIVIAYNKQSRDFISLEDFYELVVEPTPAEVTLFGARHV